jgi:hypothetical protein
MRMRSQVTKAVRLGMAAAIFGMLGFGPLILKPSSDDVLQVSPALATSIEVCMPSEGFLDRGRTLPRNTWLWIYACPMYRISLRTATSSLPFTIHPLRHVTIVRPVDLLPANTTFELVIEHHTTIVDTFHTDDTVDTKAPTWKGLTVDTIPMHWEGGGVGPYGERLSWKTTSQEDPRDIELLSWQLDADSGLSAPIPVLLRERPPLFAPLPEGWPRAGHLGFQLVDRSGNRSTLYEYMFSGSTPEDAKYRVLQSKNSLSASSQWPPPPVVLFNSPVPTSAPAPPVSSSAEPKPSRCSCTLIGKR